jgi:L-ascorbate metabolism protein UlaG (beta-lactamase superfamily)
MQMSRRHLFSAAAAAVPALGLAGLFLGVRSSRYYEGPPSDHFDGTRFFDPHGSPPHGLYDLLRWRVTQKPAAWPEWAPSPHADRPPKAVDDDRLRVSFVGHASLLIQSAGRNILIDPVWSRRVSPVSFAGPKRVNDPGIAFADLPPIDTVLVSHGHYDHLDVETLSRLTANHQARILTPLGNDAIMRAHDSAIIAEAFDWHQSVRVSEDIGVTFVPMHHWTARGVFDRNKALWAGFVIDTPAGRIYHVSDSGYGEGRYFRAARERYGPFRLAIIPIGAYEPRWFMSPMHMNPQESVQTLLDCGAEFALAHHHGTFQLTDEAIDAPAQALAQACAAAGIPAARFRVLAPGEVWELPHLTGT